MSVGNCIRFGRMLTYDIIGMFCKYISPNLQPGQATNMSNPPLSTMYTQPAIIKPYAFPNPSCQARPPIPGIDPQLHPGSPPDHPRRVKFSAEDLKHLARLAAEEEPWAKPHGQIMKSWDMILRQLQSEGRFRTSSVSTLQNKLNTLVAWQEVS